jgi:osmoprotectant transport system substrate-binding protein
VAIAKSSAGWCVSGVVLGALVLTGASCGGSKKPIVVGSKSGTAQAVLAEIVAQHLEHRLGRKVTRNSGMGNTQLVYQSLMNGEIGIYPEETGTIETGILKVPASLDASTTLERVRNEMRRLAQVEVLDPLGIENTWAVVVRKDEAEKYKIAALSDASADASKWKLGVTRDFNERSDGLSLLNEYRIPMGAMTRVADAAALYGALEAGELSMVVGNPIDGQLARHSDWKILVDDKKVFPFYQTCLLARADLLTNDPKIQPALAELSGKFTNQLMGKLDAEVDVDHKKVSDVAAEFLAQAGLK